MAATDVEMSTENNTLDVLETLERESKKYPTIKVDREDNLTYDLAHLAAFDPKSVDSKRYKQEKESYLVEVGRDNTQLLLNRLFDLPTKRTPTGVVAELPEVVVRLPRSRPVPKPKGLTKWEKFARERGIKKKKKEKLAWDDNSQGWKPRYGYKRADAVEENWVMDAKASDEVGSDPWAKNKQSRRERVGKQQVREEKNRKRNLQQTKPDLPATIAITHASTSRSVSDHKGDVERALSKAQTSTISMGRFDKVLPNEKPVKKKSKLLSYGNEKEKSQKILDRLISKKDGGVIDVNKAVSRTISSQQKKKSRAPPASKKQKR